MGLRLRRPSLPSPVPVSAGDSDVLGTVPLRPTSLSALRFSITAWYEQTLCTGFCVSHEAGRDTVPLSPGTGPSAQ